MAIRGLKKRRSWPTYDRTRNVPVGRSFDQNPFAHYISTPENNDQSSDESNVSAGITSTRPSARRCHSLSPDLRKTRAFLLRHGPASSPTFKLKRWIERIEGRYFHRSPRFVETSTPSPRVTQNSPDSPQVIDIELGSPRIIEIAPKPLGSGIALQQMPTLPDMPQVVTVSPPSTGRRNNRVRPRQRPGWRRPRSWSAPGAGLWTVTEEAEGEEIGLGIFAGEGRMCKTTERQQGLQ